MDRISNKREMQWFILYFLMVFTLLTGYYVWLCSNDRVMMFMDIGADTYCGNWPLFEAAIRWWKSFPGSLWDFSHGLGNSFAASSSTLFNPFIIFLFFFNNSIDGINLMIYLEYICLSLAAYALYRKMGLFGGTLVIAALCHTFCGFMVGWGQHYSFGSMFVFYTLMTYGFERYQQTGKWGLISFCVAVIGGMYIYFLYMILLFSALWWSVRFFYTAEEKNIKQYFLFGIKLCGVVLVGILLCLPSFVEQVKQLLNAVRVSGDLEILNSSIADTNELITTVFRSLSNVLMGINEMPLGSNFYEAPILYTGLISWFGIIGYTMFWIRRKRVKGLIYACALAFIVLFPNLVSVVFNGFSTSTPRWYFVFVPVQCYLTGRGIQYLLEDRKALVRTVIPTILLLICAGYIYITYVLPRFTMETATQWKAALVLCVAAILFIIILCASKSKRNNLTFILLSLIVAFEMGANGFFAAGNRTLSKSNLLIPGYWTTTGYYDGTQDVLKQIDEIDNGFFRIAKNFHEIDLTSPLFQNYYGETYYYSATSSYSSSLIHTYGLRIPDSNYFYGFNGKQELRNLYGAKYLLSKEPLNYANHRLMGKINDVYIYLNENNVGLTSFYSHTTNSSEYQKMSMLERNDLLYNTCVINDMDNISTNTSDIKSHRILMKQLDCIVTEKTNDSIDLYLKDIVDGSIEIEFNNQSAFSGALSVYYSDGPNMTEGKKVNLWVPTGSQSITIMEKNVHDIRIVGNSHILDVLEIKVWQRDDAYVQKATDSLRKSGMTIDDFSQQRIKGSISCDKPGVLVFAINYSDGWKAYVDGVNTETLVCNEAFVGIPMSSGIHTIELCYHPNLFYTQVLISLITGTVLLLCCMISTYREHKRHSVSNSIDRYL